MASGGYSQEQALADGLIIKYGDCVLQGEQSGNCPTCFKVGPYPHTCVECNRTIVFFINAERDIVNPRLIARLGKPPITPLAATTRTPPGLTLPLRPPIDVHGWTLDLGLWDPWAATWLHNQPSGYMSLIAIYHGDWETLATFGNARWAILQWLGP